MLEFVCANSSPRSWFVWHSYTDSLSFRRIGKVYVCFSCMVGLCRSPAPSKTRRISAPQHLGRFLFHTFIQLHWFSPIRIYFAKSYIIQNIVLHHLGYSRQFQPRSQLFPWATHPQQRTPRSSVSPGRLQFVICVASGRAGGVNATVIRTCPVFEFSVGEFWFYFFVLLLVAMSYNWRCVYVWYV